MKIFKNSKNQNGGRCELFKKEGSKNGNSKKGNFSKSILKMFLRPSQKGKFPFLELPFLDLFLKKTFILALILLFGNFENLHKSIIDFLILTRSHGKKIKSDSESWETSPNDPRVNLLTALPVDIDMAWDALWGPETESDLGEVGCKRIPKPACGFQYVWQLCSLLSANQSRYSARVLIWEPLEASV